MDFNDLEQMGKPEWEQNLAGDFCPQCDDGQLVERYSRGFESADKKGFLGCSNFPSCRFTQNI